MSDEKFDNKIRELLDNHEPDVRPDWGRMKERIAAPETDESEPDNY